MVKADLSCSACLTALGLVLLDPIELEEAAEAELLAAGPPRGIILTNGNHARAAERYRTRFSIPIYTHAEAAAEYPFEVDHLVSDGETILDEFTVIALPGAASGEIALHRGDAPCTSATPSFTCPRPASRRCPIGIAPIRGNCGARWENCCGFPLNS